MIALQMPVWSSNCKERAVKSAMIVMFLPSAGTILLCPRAPTDCPDPDVHTASGDSFRGQCLSVAG